MLCQIGSGHPRSRACGPSTPNEGTADSLSACGAAATHFLLSLLSAENMGLHNGRLSIGEEVWHRRVGVGASVGCGHCCQGVEAWASGEWRNKLRCK